MGKKNFAYRCMTHDIYIVKTRTNKYKHTRQMYCFSSVNVGYGLDNCYSTRNNQRLGSAG